MSVANKVTLDTQAGNKSRKAAVADHPSVFAEFYNEDINIAIWQRELSSEIKKSVNNLLNANSNFQKTLVVSSKNIYTKLINADSALMSCEDLCADIAELVDMYCVLYELQQVGLRLATLDRAMCPRFHVDRVPSRLVCSYHGTASEWLPHDLIDRSKLGRGNNGLPDELSGLYQSEKDINQLSIGDVAMLKGELWPDNLHAGLVHRSPQVPEGEKRLLLTLDFQG